MFRRKTDQVYATLQQVQRRLTQTAHDDGEAERQRATAPAGEARPATGSFTRPATGAFARPSGSPGPVAPNPQLPTGATIPTGAQIPPPGVAPAHRRHVLQLSGELATVIFLVWLVTLVASFFVGQHFGKRGVAPADPGAGYAAGDAGARPPRAPPAEAPANPTRAPATTGQPAAGNFILVLASVARANPDDEQRFANDAKRLNQYAEQNARSGYKPWFGVRKPASGGLQLVFGVVNGQFGVNKDEFASFTDALDRAGYKGAHWIRVSDK